MTEDAREQMAGRVAVVTGGARRLGRAIALELGAAGYRVAVTFQQSEQEATATVDELRSRGVDAAAFRMDVREEASVIAAGAAIIEQMGRVDALVNNAGIFPAARLESMTAAEWDEVFAVHARGPMLVTRELLPELRRRRGRVVHIGSLGSGRAWSGYTHYSASKAALEALTRGMAREFAPEVSVNCVSPGWIEMDSGDREKTRHFAVKTPMGRNGRADEVAAAVRFFITGPEFVTGQILAVDGGLSLV